MILVLSLLFSIGIVVVWLRFNKRRDHPGIRLIAGLCFFVSWLFICFWLSATVETWQYSLGRSAISDPALPAWNQVVLGLLQEAAYLLPISRSSLGVLYAAPLLLLSLGLALFNRKQTTRILFYGTGANLVFFWSQVVLSVVLPRPTPPILAIEGVLLLMMYGLVCLGLLWQARLWSRPLLPLILLFLLTAATPGPLPTPTLPPEYTQSARIELPPAPLHGPPPYQATLSGSVTNSRFCQSLTITPGDGTSLTLPCFADTGGRFSLDYTYETAGTYHARAIMTLNDDQTVHSNSQTVVVAPEQPVAWSALALWWSL